jgi:hypothetical protein
VVVVVASTAVQEVSCAHFVDSPAVCPSRCCSRSCGCNLLTEPGLADDNSHLREPYGSPHSNPYGSNPYGGGTDLFGGGGDPYGGSGDPASGFSVGP